MENFTQIVSATVRRKIGKLFFIILGIPVLLGFILFFCASLYTQWYEGRVYPGVSVASYDLGGLKPAAVKSFIENMNNRYAKEGIDLTIAARGDEEKGGYLFKLVTVSDAEEELVRLDSEAFADTALAAGRTGNFWFRLLRPIYYGFIDSRWLTVPIVANDVALHDALVRGLKSREDIAENANVAFDRYDLTLTLRVVPEKMGLTFDYEAIAQHIKEGMARLSFSPVTIKLTRFQPTITAQDIEPVVSRLERPLEYGDLALNYIDPETKTLRSWVLSRADIARLVEVRRDDNDTVILGLKSEAVNKYLVGTVKPFVDVAPREAKFVFENDKVQAFQASQVGLTVDLDKTYIDLDVAFRARNYAPAEAIKTVSVTVSIAEPKVKTADVNNLGITDIIGVGFSTFKDSHTNRIKNIAHAVERLNGTLIKSGEVFSANKSAGPYTTANGYLPEQVIKGNEIKPEVGGGMCQIGTTLFRMAMNSGMDILERRNHSLVVSYYADPVNGNPGTDATLYEPILDFKFMNDTGNYLLLQTAIDYKKQQLTFTLWGKPDGRTGSYTHPLVSRWISAGEPQEIPVDSGKLKVGERRCQAAFRGAVASFTYTRTTPEGETVDRVFDSYYRPLPKICTVGVEPGSCPNGVCPPPPEEPLAVTP